MGGKSPDKHVGDVLRLPAEIDAEADYLLAVKGEGKRVVLVGYLVNAPWNPFNVERYAS